MFPPVFLGRDHELAPVALLQSRKRRGFDASCRHDSLAVGSTGVGTRTPDLRIMSRPFGHWGKPRNPMAFRVLASQTRFA
jgi:hypothetical protein